MMKDVKDSKRANCVDGGGKMEFRKICVEYWEEFIFGLILGLSVLVSYGLGYLIPVDFYVNSLNPILNGCIATVSLFGAIVLFRHHKGVHVRILWACILLIWAVLSTLLLMHVMAYNAPLDTDETISLKGRELIIGDFYAWLLMLYPVAVGDTPWWFMLLLAGGYIAYRSMKRRTQAGETRKE